MTLFGEIGRGTYKHGGVYNLQEATQLIPDSELSEVDLLSINYDEAEIISVPMMLEEGIIVNPDVDYLYQ